MHHTQGEQQSQAQPHPSLVLRRLPGRYAMCRLDVSSNLPEWAIGGGFMSATRTDEELSIVVDERLVPDQRDGVAVEPGWIALRIVGRLDFALVGILAKLTSALAEANVPVCAISTFDTDVLLVKEENFDRAAAALSRVAPMEDSS